MDDGAGLGGTAEAPPVVADEPSVTTTTDENAMTTTTMAPARARRLLVEAGVLVDSDASVIERVERLSGESVCHNWFGSSAGPCPVTRHD